MPKTLNIQESLEERAVARCVDEMARALFYLRALQGLSKTETYHSIDFIQLAAWALHDQMLMHMCKVLIDKKSRNDGCNIWFLIEKSKNIIDCNPECLDLIKEIRIINEKLIKIRDGTLAHIDKKSVRNPRKFWKGKTGSSRILVVNFQWGQA